jgi:hypothetical protein
MGTVELNRYIQIALHIALLGCALTTFGAKDNRLPADPAEVPLFRIPKTLN